MLHYCLWPRASCRFAQSGLTYGLCEGLRERKTRAQVLPPVAGFCLLSPPHQGIEGREGKTWYTTLAWVTHFTWATSQDVSASLAHFVHRPSIAHFHGVNTASLVIRCRQGRLPQETKGPRLDDRDAGLVRNPCCLRAHSTWAGEMCQHRRDTFPPAPSVQAGTPVEHATEEAGLRQIRTLRAGSACCPLLPFTTA